MKKSEESTTETKAKGYRTLRRECERCIVELQFLKRSTQVFVIVRINRINTGKNHWLYFLESFNSLVAWVRNRCNGITNLYFGSRLDTRNDISHLTCCEFFCWHHIHLEYTHLVGYIFHSCIEEFHFITLTNGSVSNLTKNDDSTEGIKNRVENQSLWSSLCITNRMRNALNNSLKNILYTFTCLTRCTDNFRTITTEKFYYLVFNFVRHGIRHVYLVDNRNNLKVMINSHIEV